MGGWLRHSRGGWMAETSGLRGPCTAPRRLCCPAWLWTATAWAPLRPDACPLLACPARCRPESTWPASISTRTRVSALRRGRPLRSPRDPGEGGPGKTTRPIPGRSRQGRGTSLSLGGSSGVRAGLAPRAGRFPGPGQRPVPRTRRRGLRGSAAFLGASALPEHTRLPKSEPPGRFKPPDPCGSRSGWGFQNLGKKRISQLHTL